MGIDKKSRARYNERAEQSLQESLMKPKRTPQEQYDSLNKAHKRMYRILLCIMVPWCAFMWVFALLEYRPFWASLVVLVTSVCVFVLNIVSGICSIKLRELKKLIDSTPRGNAEDTGSAPRDDESCHE